MSEKLAAPPLIEAICQFSFLDDNTWDWTIPGTFYEKIKPEFPLKSQQTFQAPGNPFHAPQSMTFKKNDDSAIVIIGPNMLSINHVKPYSGWDIFFPMIQNVYETYLSVIPSCRVGRVGLRYINEINLKDLSQPFRQENWLTLAPKFQGTLQKPVQMFYQRYELQFNIPEGILVHQTGIRSVDLKKSLIVDLDFISNEASSLQFDKQKVFEWINQAHMHIFETFKDSICTDLFNQFKEGNV